MEKATATSLSSRKEVGKTKTDARGFYFFSYDTSDPKLPVNNIEVVTKGTDGKEISLSKPKYNLERHEVLNLVALVSLYEREPECDRLFIDLDSVLRVNKVEVVIERNWQAVKYRDASCQGDWSMQPPFRVSFQASTPNVPDEPDVFDRCH